MLSGYINPVKRLKDIPEIEKKLVLANLAFVVLLIIVERFPGERLWPTIVLAYAPQELWTLPSIIFAAYLLRRRKWLYALGAFAPILLVTTMLMGLALPHSNIANQSHLRILTWNLYFGRGGPSLPDVALDTMPDIICLQESDPWALKQLPKILKLPQFDNWHSTKCGELLTLSRFPLRRIGTTNSALWAMVDTGEKKVVLVNVHLAAPFEANIREVFKPSALRRAEIERQAQITKLLNHLPAGFPIIVCGDFNTPPTTRSYRRFASIMDSCFARTGHGFGFSYTRLAPVVRIDHIFVTRSLHPVRCWIPKAQGSNHNPMCADLSF